MEPEVERETRIAGPEKEVTCESERVGTLARDARTTQYALRGDHAPALGVREGLAASLDDVTLALAAQQLKPPTVADALVSR